MNISPEQQSIYAEYQRVKLQAKTLGQKQHPTAQEKRQFVTATQEAAHIWDAINRGMTLDQYDQGKLHKLEDEARIPRSVITKPTSLTPEQRTEAEAFRTIVRMSQAELREGVGIPVPYTALPGNLGALVNIPMFDRIVRTKAQHSPLMDEQNVSFMRTEDGKPVQLPWASDIENTATVIGESTQDSAADIAFVGGEAVNVFQYRTPKVVCSFEALQDLGAAWNVVDFISDILGDRLIRGAGKDMLQGSGNGKSLGLVPSILALGNNNVVVAAGSAANTGNNSETGANSLGSTDLSKLLFSIPAPYRASPKMAFLMASSTLQYVAGLVDKNGKPLIDLNADELRLYGKRILIDEGMDAIGASKYPVAAGDLDYWLTRVAIPQWYLRIYKENLSLVEKGQFAVALFARVGGSFMHSDPSAPSPVWLLQNHS